MSFWKNYNNRLLALSELMLAHNKKSRFNFVESSFYPHIRDILAVTISLIVSGQVRRHIRILDYGSNVATWANLQNKIDTSCAAVTIFDPFATAEQRLRGLPYKSLVISPSLRRVQADNYDLVIFGSVAQYDEDFVNDLGAGKSFKTRYILFTHTPLSIGQSFSSKQASSYTGTQTIHGLDMVVEELKKENFELIFKSTLSNSLAAVEEKFLPTTVYANLLFKRQEVV